jgi:hypothetical protein
MYQRKIVQIWQDQARLFYTDQRVLDIFRYNHYLPVKQFDEIIFVVSTVDFESLQIADVGLLVLPEGHVTDDRRLFQSENQILEREIKSSKKVKHSEN